MNILFMGLGSIGQRHLQNLISTFGNEFDYYAVRNTSHNVYIKDGVAKDVSSLAKIYGLIEFFDIDKAFETVKFDIVYITNPSSMHLEGIKRAVKEGCAVFVEKPLCVDMVEVEKIKQFHAKDSIVYVGYQTQFDPLYQALKDLIASRDFGMPVSFRSEWGTYLPDHHKYEDYRRGYAARKSLGGGVLLGLSHELDIILDIFGFPLAVASVESKNRQLEIEADDTFSVLCKFENNGIQFSGTLNLSYSQKFETRFLNLHFEKGFISFDFVKRTCAYLLGKMTEPTVIHSSVTRNETFTKQTIAFIDAVKNKDFNFDNFDRAASVVNFVENIKNGRL